MRKSADKDTNILSSTLNSVSTFCGGLVGVVFLSEFSLRERLRISILEDFRRVKGDGLEWNLVPPYTVVEKSI